MEAGRLELHRECTATRRDAIQHHRVHSSAGLLPERSCRQQQAVAVPPLVLDGDFDVARQPVVLETVVANQQVALGMRREQRPCRPDPVAADPYWRAAPLGKQDRLVAEARRIAGRRRFVRCLVDAAISSRHDPRSEAARAKRVHEPEHERGLAGATRDQIAHDDHGDGQALGAQPTGTVSVAPERDHRAEDERGRREGNGQPAQAIPVAFGEARARARGAGRGHLGCVWVANETCERPASRAASMTWITDWWLAFASALMTTIGSFRPPAACRIASPNAATLENANGLRSIVYWPAALTVMFTSFGRSVGFSASALGRLICSSANLEYVVVIIRKMRITRSTSIIGIRLTSGSSFQRPRKFIARPLSDPLAVHHVHEASR